MDINDPRIKDALARIREGQATIETLKGEYLLEGIVEMMLEQRKIADRERNRDQESQPKWQRFVSMGAASKNEYLPTASTLSRHLKLGKPWIRKIGTENEIEIDLTHFENTLA